MWRLTERFGNYVKLVFALLNCYSLLNHRLRYLFSFIGLALRLSLGLLTAGYGYTRTRSTDKYRVD